MRNMSGWITNSGDHDELSNIAGVTFSLAQYFTSPPRADVNACPIPVC